MHTDIMEIEDFEAQKESKNTPALSQTPKSVESWMPTRPASGGVGVRGRIEAQASFQAGPDPGSLQTNPDGLEFEPGTTCFSLGA